MTRIHDQARTQTNRPDDSRKRDDARRPERGRRDERSSFADRLREQRGDARQAKGARGEDTRARSEQARAHESSDEHLDTTHQDPQKASSKEREAPAEPREDDTREQERQDAQHETTAHVEVLHEVRTEQRVEVSAGEQVAEGQRADLESVVEAMVEACHVGQDAEGRKVMVMELAVPGRGRLLARLRRTRQGVRVQLRTDDASLKRELTSARGELLDAARAKGAKLLSVDVA